MEKVKELEAAILARADRLAEQYRAQAQRSRDEILREASNRLKLREEREVLVAKAMAERTYRRRVQSHELKLQARLDQLRWNLTDGVRERLLRRLSRLVADADRYLPILEGLIREGVSELALPAARLAVNSTDLKRLQAAPRPLAERLGLEVELTLEEHPIDCIGGAMLLSPDRRIRLDNTFEGRLHRRRRELYQAIQTRLLPPRAEDISSTLTTG